MIKIAFISSIQDIEEIHPLGHIEMALTHLLIGDQSYANHFRRAAGNRYVILDNSIMELGEAMAGETVLSVAKEFKPNVVVAPDSFNNRKETLARTTSFIRAKKKILELMGTHVMAVAHGKDWENWKECFESHQKNDAVDIIGLPYGTTFQIPNLPYQNLASKTAVMMDNRIAMTVWIKAKFKNPKPCHLLGASDPLELFSQKRFNFIISHDSSSAYASGYNSVLIHKNHGLSGKEKFKMDFNWRAIPVQMEMIKSNIDTILSMVKP